MDSLPREIFDIIIKFISSTESPTYTFRNLRAANKALHQLFTPLSFPSITVENTQQSASNFKSLLESPLAAHVKKLTVYQNKSFKEQHPNIGHESTLDSSLSLSLSSLPSLSSLTALTLKFSHTTDPFHRSINTTFQHAVLSLCSTSPLPSLRCLSIDNLLISLLPASWPTSVSKLASALTQVNLSTSRHPHGPDKFFGEGLLKRPLEPVRDSLISSFIKDPKETLNPLPPALGWMRFPRLERLGLNKIVFSPHQGMLELIREHSTTLRVLVLVDCVVDFEHEIDEDGAPMLTHKFDWADIWRILETEMTSLVELRTADLLTVTEFFAYGDLYSTYMLPSDKDREALESIMGVVGKRKKAGELGKLRG